MYRFGIRTLIVALAFAGGLMGLLGGGLVLLEVWREEQRSVQGLLLETARAFSLSLDGEFDKIRQELAILARLDPEGADFVVLARASADLVGGTGSWITLFAPDGRRLVTTLSSSPTNPADGDDLEFVRNIARTRQFGISNVFVSRLASRPVAVVGVPVLRDDQIRYVVTIAVPAEHFGKVLNWSEPPRDWLAAIVDRAGAMVARFPSALGQPGQESAPSLVGAMQRTDEGTYTYVDFEGVLLDGAFTRSRLSGWSVGVGVPANIMEAPFRRSLFELGIITFFLALFGFLLAWLLGQRVARSLASLSRAAEALGCDDAPLKPDMGIREIEQTGAAILDAAELLKRRSAERDSAIKLLRSANENLEERVRQRTGDLVAANRQLSEEISHRRDAEQALTQQRKMEAIGQLTAGIAHDFNNLLTAVIGNLDMLRHRLADERSQTLARNASSAAERAAGLTKQLLAFGRKQRLETRIVAINDLITGAAPLLGQASGPLVALDLQLAKDAGAVAVDPAQMELALLNLAINARDAMPAGGSLVIATERLIGEQRDVAPGDWVLISVADTGSGMSPEVLARAFEPFFTTKDVGMGSGLGLSMVYGLIKQLGGEVAIVSAPGAGTRVKIYLPHAADAAKEPGDGVPETPASGPQVKVMVVDDNPAVLGFMANVLREAGHEVIEAPNGFVALRLFGDGATFDAVVLDYAMPGMNGAVTASAMRARRARLPILLVTGFAEAVMPGRWPEEDILHKPFTAESLRQRVEALIASSPGRAVFR